MAELAGLIIGGVSLVAMFESCMTIIDYVDSGRNFTTGYQDAAFDITLLGARLARWERTYIQSPPADTTEEDGEKAEAWLEQICKRLQDAQLTGEKDETKTIAPPSTTALIMPAPESKGTGNKSQLTDKIREKLLKRFRSSPLPTTSSPSLASKARWALHDEAKMTTLIEKLTRYISHLEAIFPALPPALAAAAAEEASLIRPSEIEEPEDAILAIEQSAQRVDLPLGHM